MPTEAGLTEIETDIKMPRRYLGFAPVGYAFDIMRPLQAEALRRGDEFRWVTLDGLDSALSKNEQNLPNFAAVMAYQPDAVFSPVHWVPYFFPGIKVQVFHGFDIDKHGNDDHFRLRGWFDLFLTQGASTTQRFSAMALEHGYFDVRETGWAKLDPLFSNSTAARSTPENKPCILYASTFSRKVCSIPILAPVIQKLQRERDWHWLLTTHPKTSAANVDQLRSLVSDNAEFVRNEALMPILKAADVIVCDTSSIVYEFLLQQRPAVTYRNFHPGDHLINITNPDQLEQAIETALMRPPELMTAIKSFSDHIHPCRDGHSAARCLDAVSDHLDHFKPRKPKPRNWFRKWQLRQRLRKLEISDD